MSSQFYETRFSVYFDDLDAFQILHNARYLLLFERALGEFWAKLFGWPPLLSTEPGSDQCHLVRANHLEYHAPVRGVGSVRIRLQVKRLGRTSVTFVARFLPPNQDIECAYAERVLVKVHPDSHEPLPWTDTFRTMLTTYLVPNNASDESNL